MKFEKEELIILKPQFDDSNYKRVYQIVDIEDGLLKVKAISEKSTDPGKFPENSDNSLINKIRGPYPANIFNPYL